MARTAISNNKKLKLFNLFLIKHGVFFQFYYNMLKKHGNVKIISRIMKNSYPYDYIMRGFYWGGTKEDSDFWNQLHIEWIKLLKKL